jgi:hypothetical protein
MQEVPILHTPPGCIFRAGATLLPLVAFTFGTDRRRCSCAVLSLSSAAALLGIISISQTKLFWYAAPNLPLLAIAAALGISDGLRSIKIWELQVAGLLREAAKNRSRSAFGAYDRGDFIPQSSHGFAPGAASFRTDNSGTGRSLTSCKGEVT